MDEQKRIFSINLNNLIARKRITQRQFADALGFKWTTVNTWCKGGSFPTSGKLQKIADYFHVGKGDLIDSIIVFDEQVEVPPNHDFILSMDEISREMTAKQMTHILKYAEFIKASTFDVPNKDKKSDE